VSGLALLSSDRQNAISSHSTAANEYPRVVLKLAVEISITTRLDSEMNSPVSVSIMAANGSTAFNRPLTNRKIDRACDRFDGQHGDRRNFARRKVRRIVSEAGEKDRDQGQHTAFATAPANNETRFREWRRRVFATSAA
jgi:hypothetical protein